MFQTSLRLIQRLSKTETPIFYLECVLCFLRQHFRFLFMRALDPAVVTLLSADGIEAAGKKAEVRFMAFQAG